MILLLKFVNFFNKGNSSERDVKENMVFCLDMFCALAEYIIKQNIKVMCIILRILKGPLSVRETLYIIII